MSATFSLSSGDPAADRRVDFALMLFADGDHKGAAETLLGALEIVPGWALGWYKLGEIQEAAGDLKAAAIAWHNALALDPADHSGAKLMLALAGVGEAEAAPPSAFVETLFDQYADKFDHSLVATLGYRVPELLIGAITAASPQRFGLALDLGCGTGLMGERLRPVCDRLEGFDISGQMLRKARAKNIYDRLEKTDLTDFACSEPKADLVVAADVFMYVGPLDRIVAKSRQMLSDGGLFAFSGERLDREDGFALQPSRRYAHSEGYVRQVLSEAGLSVISLEDHVIRQDRGRPVAGMIVTAGKV